MHQIRLVSLFVPSAKRERIRANQAKKRAEVLAVKKKKSRIRRIVIIAVLAVLALVAIYYVSRPVKTSKQATTAKSVTTTTAARAAAAPLPCPPVTGSATRVTKFPAAPPMCITASATYTALVKTDVGSFTITLDPTLAPKTVNNFVYLARYQFYNGIIFHRVIPGFVVQGGDPTGTGAGGPGYEFADELPPAGSYRIGTVAMANSGPNTNGSQFFIVVGANGTQLPPNYSIFGQVTSGMSVVNAIAADGTASGTPTVVHKMIQVTITGP